ncbi:MAG TPA: PqqD family protein [Chloroflexia bacterium]|nr:PqqD family protein [Chloroflexia bacterium]
MKLSIPEDVLIQDLDGELVLLNLENEQYYGLDEVGSAMWTALTKSESVEAACQSLEAAYEVEPERLEQDLHEFVEQLVKNGLLKVAEN